MSMRKNSSFSRMHNRPKVGRRPTFVKKVQEGTMAPTQSLKSLVPHKPSTPSSSKNASPRTPRTPRHPERLLKRDDKADLIHIGDGLTVKLIPIGDGKFSVDFELPDPIPPNSGLSGLATTANAKNREALDKLASRQARMERGEESGKDGAHAHPHNLADGLGTAASDHVAHQDRVARARQFEHHATTFLGWIDVQLGLATKDEVMMKLHGKARNIGKKLRQAKREGPKTKPIGRTPNPVIAMNLESKLNALRHNPGELKRLRQRILSERDKARAKRGDHGPEKSFEAKNMTVMSKKQSEDKKKEFFTKSKARESQAIEKREAHLQETLHRRLFYFKANKLQRRRHEHEQLREDEIARARKRIFQKKWLILLQIAARQRVFSIELRLARIKRERRERRVAACLKIQRAWRGLVMSRRQAEVTEALEVLTRWFRRVKLLRGLAKKRLRARTIIDFLVDRKNTAAIVGVIRSFQQNVLAGQRIGRAYVLIKRARLDLLERQYDKVQAELAAEGQEKSTTSFKQKTREQQLRAIRKRKEEKEARWRNPSRGAGIPETRSGKGKGKGKGKGDSRSRPEMEGMLSTRPTITHNHIKERLLRDTLTEIRTEYYSALEAWRDRKVKWDNRYSTQKQLSNVRGILLKGIDHQERGIKLHSRQGSVKEATETSGVPHPGARPYLIGLLPKPDMVRLVTVGLDLSAQWNRQQVSYRLGDRHEAPSSSSIK